MYTSQVPWPIYASVYKFWALADDRADADIAGAEYDTDGDADADAEDDVYMVKVLFTSYFCLMMMWWYDDHVAKIVSS